MLSADRCGILYWRAKVIILPRGANDVMRPKVNSFIVIAEGGFDFIIWYVKDGPDDAKYFSDKTKLSRGHVWLA